MYLAGELVAEGEGGAGGAGRSSASATRRDNSEMREVPGGAKKDEVDREPVVEERGNGEEGADDVEA